MVNLISFLGVMLFTLGDFYIIGIGRVFDYIVLIYAVLIFLLIFKNWFRIIPYFLFFFLFFFLFNCEGKPLGAILCGICFIFPLFQKIKYRKVSCVLDISLALILIGFYIQLFSFVFLKFSLNFSDLLGGIPSRIYDPFTGFFRPSSFFQEPNTFVLHVFFIESLRYLLNRRISKQALFGILSIFLSQSLWGYLIVLLFLGLYFKNFLLKKILYLITLIITLSFLFIYFKANQDKFTLPITIHRILNIEKEPSLKDRIFSSTKILDAPNIFLGNGISTKKFQHYGANSFSFMIYCFGIFGVSILLIIFGFYFKSLIHFLFLFCAFLTFPFFTSMIFWAWLSLLVLIKKNTHIKHINNEMFYNCEK